MHSQLREASARLGEQRAALAASEARNKARDERRLKIQNLRRVASEERRKLNVLQQQHGAVQNPNQPPIRIGDADIVLAVHPPNVLPSTVLENANLLQTLVPEYVRTRLNAYAENNANLERSIADLKSRSRDVEAKYRRLLSHCVNIPSERLDDIVESLMEAVDSEGGDVELGRVKDFLGRVERDAATSQR